MEGASHGVGVRPRTGLSPSGASRSRELRAAPLPKHPLQTTTRTPGAPDFKFELLPLHSPLLGQSLLVSFPPLIDMLKFSGYPYLIRGQTIKVIGSTAGLRRDPMRGALLLRRGRRGGTATSFKGLRAFTPADPQHRAAAGPWGPNRARGKK